MNGQIKETEIVLLQQMQAGDMEAFSQLYHLYAPLLYRRLLRLLKNPENVEEIIQDVFLKIWEKREHVEPDRGFRTFLYRISDHLAIDMFRKISRDKELQIELWAASVSFYFHCEESVFSKEKRTILQEAIDSLAPKRREIVRLCKIEDHSYKEVADLLGISVSTVSNQLVSAMKDIRHYITQHYRQDYLATLYAFFIFYF